MRARNDFICYLNEEIFTATAKSAKNIHTVAIADDFYIVGPPDDVITAYRTFSKLCAEDGSIVPNKKKHISTISTTNPSIRH